MNKVIKVVLISVIALCVGGTIITESIYIEKKENEDKLLGEIRYLEGIKKDREYKGTKVDEYLALAKDIVNNQNNEDGLKNVLSGTSLMEESCKKNIMYYYNNLYGEDSGLVGNDGGYIYNEEIVVNEDESESIGVKTINNKVSLLSFGADIIGPIIDGDDPGELPPTYTEDEGEKDGELYSVMGYSVYRDCMLVRFGDNGEPCDIYKMKINDNEKIYSISIVRMA